MLESKVLLGMTTLRNMVIQRCLAFISILLLSFLIGIQGSHFSRTDVCQNYHGICETRLNSTAPRYINTTLGLNKTEELARQLLNKVVTTIYERKKESDKKCHEIVESTVCFFLFPFCSTMKTKMDYCREDCDYLFSICGEDLNRLVGAGKSLLRGQLSATIFRFDECKNFKSEEELALEGNKTCKHLPYIDIPAMQKRREELNTEVIIIIALAVPAVIFVLILCTLHHRRLSNKARLHSIHYENGGEAAHGVKKASISTVVSMRDRIREWKVAPSELTELVDICKSRGVLEIPVDNIEYLKDLGAGQYGLVFQGKMNNDIEEVTSNIVAVKTLREGSSHDAIKEFCQEVNIMSTFNHPNVVKLIGVSLAGEPYCMIFEFVEFGDLASFLRNCGELSEEKDSAYPKLTVTDQLSMAVQIASGMKYISSIRCVHRDLAARNCLVSRGLVVKISDFGLSRDVYVSEYYRMDKTRMLPVRWLPPEAFVDGKFTTYSDVYSYGILLWEIFTFAQLPYEDHDNNKTMELILEGHLLSKPEACPSPVYDIMLKCWHINPEKRILFPEIINELCSLDDFGQRFEAQIDDIHENFKARTLDKATCYSNEGCDIVDEQPINIERLPSKPITAKHSHYATPVSNKAQNDDGMVTLPAVNQPTRERYTQIETPRAVHPTAPPQDRGTNGSVEVPDSPRLYDDVNNDQDYPQENYDIPPKHKDDDGEETYSVPLVPRHGYEQETYDVPPQGAPDRQEETYDVPPPKDEPQETYDVPPGSIKRPLIQQDSGKDDEEQETYDVPPKQEESDDIYQNSLEVTPKTGHYSVPQSPFLKRRKENNSVEATPQPSAKHSYENVDFDGKPLLTS